MSKLNIIQKECPTHGLTDYYENSKGKSFCKKCNVERVSEARRKNKKKILEEFGSKCCICGYSKYAGALHFHHLIPEDKEFSISQKGTCKSLEKIREEAKNVF